jgi:hypothetical protein
MSRGSLLLALLTLIACACASGRPAPAEPWRAPAIARGDAPPVLISEWSRAKNRDSCAPFTFASLGEHADAKPRSAYFAGGWGVAWDKPGLPGLSATGAWCRDCGRGAFGIAGTGALASGPSYTGWPHERVWRDGSRAGYGPEGGTGERTLAYVTISGEECLYNVWSFLGVAHLEQLLEQMRRVDVE